jgi:uncharacterized protein (DUF305 family)
VTRPPLVLRIAAPVVLVTVGLSGCGAGGQEAAPPPATVQFTAAPDVPVVVPGSPGDPTRTIEPGETGEMPNAGLWAQADVDFLQAMVPHHAQALEMAQLAPDRASDERVLLLAERIAAAQGPEIEAMQAWLRANDLPEADTEDHSHAQMRGMATTEEMLALDAARGDEFDRFFLELMTKHHEGALEMATDAGDARNVLVVEMVQDTAVKQGVEIGRMQELLADLA